MKYYLKAERMIRHTPYLKLNIKANTVVFDKKECGENYQNTFTEEEIARLPKWCQELTRELVDEKESCFFCKTEYGRFISSKLVMINSWKMSMRTNFCPNCGRKL